jgi:cytochrome c553
MKVALLVAIAVAVLPPMAHDQVLPPRSVTPPAPVAAQACVTCHGALGEGAAATGAPRIAGQSQHYLAKQLESYVNGSRRSPVMESVAKGLPPDIRAAVAAYYSQVDAPVAGGTSTRRSRRGLELATSGDSARRVQACGNCHGPGGTGEPPLMPYLAGLDAGYLARELAAWKAGTRTNDAGQQMKAVADALNGEDVAAVAAYYASLPPPKPAPLQLVIAPDRRALPAPGAAAAGTQREQATPARVGAGQGAATGGGAEGPGGDKPSEQRNRGGDAAKKGRTSASRRDRRASGRQQGDSGAAVGDTAIIASGSYGCAACLTVRLARDDARHIAHFLHLRQSADAR